MFETTIKKDTRLIGKEEEQTIKNLGKIEQQLTEILKIILNSINEVRRELASLEEKKEIVFSAQLTRSRSIELLRKVIFNTSFLETYISSKHASVKRAAISLKDDINIIIKLIETGNIKSKQEAIDIIYKKLFTPYEQFLMVEMNKIIKNTEDLRQRLLKMN